MTVQIPQTRRWFLSECRLGLGSAALAGLMSEQNAAAAQRDPMSVRSPHFEPKAKAVIHLFMAGAPSQLELFDEKPTLTKLEGKPLPKSVIGDQRYAFIQPDAAVMGPRYSFEAAR